MVKAVIAAEDAHAAGSAKVAHLEEGFAHPDAKRHGFGCSRNRAAIIVNSTMTGTPFSFGSKTARRSSRSCFRRRWRSSAAVAQPPCPRLLAQTLPVTVPPDLDSAWVHLVGWKPAVCECQRHHATSRDAAFLSSRKRTRLQDPAAANQLRSSVSTADQ